MLANFDSVTSWLACFIKRRLRTSVATPRKSKTAAPSRLSSWPQVAKNDAIACPSKKTVSAYKKSTVAIALAPATPVRQPFSRVVLISIMAIGPTGIASAKPAKNPIANRSLITTCLYSLRPRNTEPGLRPRTAKSTWQGRARAREYSVEVSI